MPADPIDQHLFPNGVPTDDKGLDRLFELYKIMVSSSEALVSRRQGVNTFFITINGALLTAIGLILGNGKDHRVVAGGLAIMTLTGALLTFAWNSLVLSSPSVN